MELNRFDTKDTPRFLHLEGPNGELLYREEGGNTDEDRVGILLIGSDSREYQKLQHRLQDERIGKVRLTKRGQVRNVSSSAAAQDGIELIARCTKGFQNVVVDGEQFPNEPGTQKVVSFYNRFPWILDQADEFIHDRSNFLGE